MIHFVNVSKHFPRPKGGLCTVLARANLRIDAGERVGILATAGTGKTTVARLISGALSPSSGAIWRGGRVSWPMGFAGGLHPALSVEENIQLAARLYHMDGHDLALRVVAFAQIGGSTGIPVGELTPGQRLRIAMGLSLCVDFDVYVADEFLTAGDPAFQDRVEAMLETRLSHAAFILLTRHARVIDALTDRAVALAGGHLIDCADPQEAREILSLSTEAKHKEHAHAHEGV